MKHLNDFTARIYVAVNRTLLIYIVQGQFALKRTPRLTEFPVGGTNLNRVALAVGNPAVDLWSSAENGKLPQVFPVSFERLF